MTNPNSRRDGVHKAGFDHPCKETCGGWKQGYDRGVDAATKDLSAEVERLRKYIPTTDNENAEHMVHHWREAAHAAKDESCRLFVENNALKLQAEKLTSALERIKSDSSKYHIAANEYSDEFDPYDVADAALTAYRQAQKGSE